MDRNVEIITELKAFLTKASTNGKKYCYNQRAFTRTRKLPFETVLLFITNLVKKSLAIELDSFFTFPHKNAIPTKGAFSQARYKLKAVFFQDWNQHLLEVWFSLNANKMNPWKGFQLCAVDGTTVVLPERPSVKEEFGNHLNQFGSFALGQVMVCYDLLNGFCLKSELAGAHADELSTALKWVGSLPNHVLTLYDRGYASFALIYLHTCFKQDFLIRCRINFNKDVVGFATGNQQTAIIILTATAASDKRLLKLGLPFDQQATLRVRLVKVKLATGEREVLITSLYDELRFPTAWFKQLYCFRWGVETYRAASAMTD